MLVMTTRRFGWWKDRTVFFPTPEFMEHCADNLALNEILRISQSPVQLARKHPRMLRYKPDQTTFLDLTKSAEELYASMDAKSCRYEIRRAEKLCDRITVGRNEAAVYDEFLALYNDFVVAKGYTRALSGRRFRNLAQAGDVFVARLDGRPLCGHLLLCDRGSGRARLALSASRRLLGGKEAKMVGSLNRYLHWHEIQLYRESGMCMYDFGGIEDGAGSIAKFKLSFGGPSLWEHCYTLGGALVSAPHKVYSRLAALARPHLKGRTKIV